MTLAAGDDAVGPAIDLNVDTGESFGRWRVADEAAVYPYVTSVNLACGFHAGDPANLLDSIRSALRHGLALGAHPGYPDKVGFGRRDMQLDERELFADTIYQLGALTGLIRAATSSVPDVHVGALRHVKAHGALYQRMTVDAETARAFARAVATFDARLPVMVLAGPGGAAMRAATVEVGVRVIEEAFPDRAYLRDGRLAPRSLAGSVLSDPDLIAARAVAMASGEPFAALDGGETLVVADTLCLHGDGVSAPAAARAVRSALEGAGIALSAP